MTIFSNAAVSTPLSVKANSDAVKGDDNGNGTGNGTGHGNNVGNALNETHPSNAYAVTIGVAAGSATVPNSPNESKAGGVSGNANGNASGIGSAAPSPGPTNPSGHTRRASGSMTARHIVSRSFGLDSKFAMDSKVRLQVRPAAAAADASPTPREPAAPHPSPSHNPGGPQPSPIWPTPITPAPVAHGTPLTGSSIGSGTTGSSQPSAYLSGFDVDRAPPMRIDDLNSAPIGRKTVAPAVAINVAAAAVPAAQPPSVGASPTALPDGADNDNGNGNAKYRDLKGGMNAGGGGSSVRNGGADDRSNTKNTNSKESLAPASTLVAVKP